MSRRLYVGRLPPGTGRNELEDIFKSFGRLVDCRPMNGFAFVEFESSRDAEDAAREWNGKNYNGDNLIVEPSKDPRRRDFNNDPYGRPPPPRVTVRSGIRVNVQGVPSSTSWQDLKDYGRMGSESILWADVDRNGGDGVIAFPTINDAEDAIEKLKGVDINGQPVSLSLAPDAGPETFESRRPPPRDFGDRPRYDDRPRYEDRRGGYEDRRPRYDDRYDDRPRYDDRRRDDRRYDDRPRHDDRRRDDRDFDRRDDRGGRDYERRDDRREERRDDRFDDRREGGGRDDRERSPAPRSRTEDGAEDVNGRI